MSQTKQGEGVVFNIQHYSIHDGPGIRTTVFMKGCPLKCVWCQNPESQSIRPEIFVNTEKCVGCGNCVEACPEGAVEIYEGYSRTNRALCVGHGKCAELCPNEARNLMGKHLSAEEVLEEVKSDEVFYKHSGGGCTLSGGDPVMQPEFAITLLKLCRDAGIHTVLDTSGYAEWETFKRILDHTNLVLYDFKHMDSAKHKEYTGVGNELILDNARKCYHELSIPMLARVPIIPGYNDSTENMEATAKFIANELGSSMNVHLLPYHRLGETKYPRLEKDYGASIDPPGDEEVEKLKGIFESFGLTVHIGG